jgi:hypothetical protein
VNSTMLPKHTSRGLATVVLLTAALAAFSSQSASNALSCGRSEAAALHDAPKGVERVSKSRLLVPWSKGLRPFADSGTVEGEMSGVAYQYCGFTYGYHLVKKNEEELFTGVLVDTLTGRVLPAGHTVIFAPDTTRYFAAQQPGGLDGEEWLLYTRGGARIWKGLSGVEAKSPTGSWTYFIATLEQPRWSTAGDLQATLRCADDTTKSAVVTLRFSRGRYRWMPAVACPSASKR